MTAVVFLKLWYWFGFSYNSLSLLQHWNEPTLLSQQDEKKRIFLQCVNQVNLYHMNYNMPLRLEAYNNLLNDHKEELCNRKNILVIENIAPVFIVLIYVMKQWLNTKHFTTFFKKQYNVEGSIFFNWLSDEKCLVQLPTEEVVDKIIEDWKEVVTSDDSDASHFSMN